MQGLLEVKELWKSIFLAWFSNAKKEECGQNVWNISCLATCFLEVGAPVSLKLATKWSDRGKKL